MIFSLSIIACGLAGGGEPINVGPQDAPTALVPGGAAPAITLTPFPTSTPTPGPTIDPDALPTLPPGTEASLVYASTRREGIQLFLLAPDGRQVANVDLPSIDFNVVWPEISPDNSKLAFAGVQGGNAALELGIFVLDINTGLVTQLSEGDGTQPRWSPDSQYLAYTCNSGSDVCAIAADGSIRANLTADSDRIERAPDWAPDGRIVFMSDRNVSQTGRFSEIYIMDSDGTNIDRLTTDATAYNANPSVSPNGTRIAFESDRDTDFAPDIYTIDIDGSNRIRVTNDTRVWNQNPVWSADNLRIYFAANDGIGNIDLFEIPGEGGQARRLTRHIAEDGGTRLGHSTIVTPFSSPFLFGREDTQLEPLDIPAGGNPQPNSILFAANDINCPDCVETGIYRVNPDGTDLVKLPIEGFYPAWSPGHVRIAYIKDGEMFMANADGGDPLQITDASLGIGAMEWGTAGSAIVAECTPYIQYDVCLINSNTGQVRNLTEIVTNDAGIPRPTWIGANILLDNFVITQEGSITRELSGEGKASPNALQLATVNADNELIVTNPDGRVDFTLTTDAATKGFPVWAPNGEQLVYSVAPGDGRTYLWVANVDPEAGAPYQLVQQPISVGPLSTDEEITTFYGYSWAP